MSIDISSIRLVSTSLLLPHELSVMDRVEEIARSMKEEGIQKDPIIVESNSLTVLDGTHRLHAIKLLNLEFAVCYMIDYSSRQVSLERWIRSISPEKKKLAYLLEALGIRKEESFEKALSLTEHGYLAVLSKDLCYVMRESNINKAYGIVKTIEDTSRAMKWKVDYVQEDEIDLELERGRTLIIGPRIRKIDVIQSARRGTLFPPKTTHHIINPRPVSIRFPVEKLREGVEITNVVRISPQQLPPESSYEGRRYKEKLVVLTS